MKGSRLLFAAAIALMIPSTPSFAGNPNIDQHMFHGRKEVQLIDESYLFNDLRRQGNVPQTIIIEAPQQSQPAPPPLMIRPGMGNQVPGVTVMHNGLPDAGFQSAINPGNIARMNRGLPSGSSTNMLAGKMLNQNPSQGRSKPLSASSGSAPKAAPASVVQPTMVYASQPSGSGMSAMSAKTSVSAKLQSPVILQRGSLLANQAHH
ncbi:MAG TPA: hypothetical protein V6C89_20065 [Drouetiella sp.]|jgi:hypothetical protein